MKKTGLLLILLFAGLNTPGQNDTLTVDDDLLRSAQQWAKENLDEDALRVLQSADQEKVRQFLAEIQKQFHGEYVVDLAGLKDAARTVLPLLESYEETLPYALWLKARLDYLEVADQFRLLIPPPKTEPGQPPRHPPNPAPQREREVWVRELAERPWPKNAKPYISCLKPIFAAEKVPPELVWIAEVESSFDPRARSPVGAAGLFQLMPDTARRYGLRTWPLDQRLKPETSGRAAAQYLRYLRGHFKDWRLALAAYNAGEGTVQSLLAWRKAASFDAIADRLPAETQMFVPKVEATLFRREGVKLSQLHLPSPSKRTP
ncbi:MAG TPA: lytic transglycosylase domain-containing protein [Candidatus Acidoferrum sp.]|jgi:membrane-bound lytic murein transglycosylase D|nr:lytic transglycosylase domain-containing protein [Candidatus Acidoferrum sp.]